MYHYYTLSITQTSLGSYFAEAPERLSKMQKEYLPPIIQAYEDKYQIKLLTTTSILPLKQQADTHTKLENILKSYDPLVLAALERATRTLKSVLLPLMMIEGHIDPEKCIHAANLEGIAQRQVWGDVEGDHDVEDVEIQRWMGAVGCVVHGVENIKAHN